MNFVDQPLVSIIINCYNGERYLEYALRSIVDQSYDNWEIIFWDNRSTDGSAEIFKKYKDHRFKYHLASTHTLLYAARNEAIKLTSGEFVAFLDVDDWWHKDKLSQQIKVFENPNVGFSCTNYEVIKNGQSKRFRRKKMPSGNVLNELIQDYYVGMLTLMIRKSAYNDLDSGFDPNYHILGDIDLVVRMASRWEMATIQEVLAYYRLHHTNESIIKKELMLEEYLRWQEKITGLFPHLELSTLNSLNNQIKYINGGILVRNGRIMHAAKVFSDISSRKLKIKLFLKIIRRLIGFNA